MTVNDGGILAALNNLGSKSAIVTILFILSVTICTMTIL